MSIPSEFQVHAHQILIHATGALKNEAESYFSALKKRPERVVEECLPEILLGDVTGSTILAAQLLLGACKRVSLSSSIMDSLIQALILHSSSPKSIQSHLKLSISAALLRNYCDTKVLDRGNSSALWTAMSEIQRLLPATCCIHILNGVAEVALSKEIWSKQFEMNPTYTSSSKGITPKGVYDQFILLMLITENTPAVLSAASGLVQLDSGSGLESINSLRLDAISLVAQWMELLIQPSGSFSVLTNLNGSNLNMLLTAWMSSDITLSVLKYPIEYISLCMVHITQFVNDEEPMSQARTGFESSAEVIVGMIQLAVHVFQLGSSRSPGSAPEQGQLTQASVATLQKITQVLSASLHSVVFELGQRCIHQTLNSFGNEDQLQACESIWNLVVRMLNFFSECGELMLPVIAVILRPDLGESSGLFVQADYYSFLTQLFDGASSIVSQCQLALIHSYGSCNQDPNDEFSAVQSASLGTMLKGMMITSTEVVSNLTVEIGKIVSCSATSSEDSVAHPKCSTCDQFNKIILSYINSSISASELTFVEPNELTESFCQLADYRKSMRETLRELCEKNEDLLICLLNETSSKLTEYTTLIQSIPSRGSLAFQAERRGLLIPQMESVAEAYFHVTSAVTKSIIQNLQRDSSLTSPWRSMIYSMLQTLTLHSPANPFGGEIFLNRTLSRICVVIIGDLLPAIYSTSFAHMLTQSFSGTSGNSYFPDLLAQSTQIIMNCIDSLTFSIHHYEVLASQSSICGIPFRVKQDHIGVVSLLKATAAIKFLVQMSMHSSRRDSFGQLRTEQADSRCIISCGKYLINLNSADDLLNMSAIILSRSISSIESSEFPTIDNALFEILIAKTPTDLLSCSFHRLYSHLISIENVRLCLASSILSVYWSQLITLFLKSGFTDLDASVPLTRKSLAILLQAAGETSATASMNSDILGNYFQFSNRVLSAISTICAPLFIAIKGCIFRLRQQLDMPPAEQTSSEARLEEPAVAFILGLRADGIHESRESCYWIGQVIFSAIETNVSRDSDPICQQISALCCLCDHVMTIINDHRRFWTSSSDSISGEKIHGVSSIGSTTDLYRTILCVLSASITFSGQLLLPTLCCLDSLLNRFFDVGGSGSILELEQTVSSIFRSVCSNLQLTSDDSLKISKATGAQEGDCDTLIRHNGTAIVAEAGFLFQQLGVLLQSWISKFHQNRLMSASCIALASPLMMALFSWSDIIDIRPIVLPLFQRSNALTTQICELNLSPSAPNLPIPPEYCVVENVLMLWRNLAAGKHTHIKTSYQQSVFESKISVFWEIIGLESGNSILAAMNGMLVGRRFVTNAEGQHDSGAIAAACSLCCGVHFTGITKRAKSTSAAAKIAFEIVDALVRDISHMAEQYRAMVLASGMLQELVRFLFLSYAGRLPSLYRDDIVGCLFTIVGNFPTEIIQQLITTLTENASDVEEVYLDCVASALLRSELGLRLTRDSRGDLKKFKAALKVLLPK